MSPTRPIRSRAQTAESLISAMQSVGRESTSSHDDLAERLIKIGVRHPDYIRSHGTVTALWNELHAIYTGVTGSSDSVEQYGRYLAKRGWYVDWISKPESLEHREIDSLSGRDPRSHFISDVVADCMTDPANGSVHPFNWTALPYDLVQRGVTHIDFEGTDADPTGALDRDLDEILAVSVGLGERQWATQLADRGWFVQSKEQGA